VHHVRLMPRFGRLNSKREVWPGGPQIGQVIEAQLTPAANPSAAGADGEEAPTGEKDRTATQLLLLLQ
jgi:hypothetical protein